MFFETIFQFDDGRVDIRGAGLTRTVEKGKICGAWSKSNPNSDGPMGILLADASWTCGALQTGIIPGGRFS